MILKNTNRTYGSISKVLHGLVSALVTVMLVVGLSMGEIQDKTLKGMVIGWHKQIGVLLLIIAILFIIWSLISTKPSYSAKMPAWERHLARFVHCCIYALLIGLPLSGWIFSTAGGRPPRILNQFELPMPWIPLSSPLKKVGIEIHSVFAWALFALLVLHLLGALKHHFIDRNNVLTRMFRW
jgi:cytochrome b561